MGQLHPPEGFHEKLRWNAALVTIQSDGNEARADKPPFKPTVSRAGLFRIDDVPAGSYSLIVRFQRDQAGHLSEYRLKVSSAKGDLSAQPVDLGVLTLEGPSPDASGASLSSKPE